MPPMMFFGFVITLLVFTLTGWMRGAIRVGLALLGFLVAGLLAQPLAPLFGWVAPVLLVPRLFSHPVNALAAGVAVFLVLSIVGNLLLRKRFQGEDRPSWDRPFGAVLGGVWGLLIVLLVTTGLATVARADRTMRHALVESELRREARAEFRSQAQQEISYYAHTMSRERVEEEIEAMVREAERGYRPDPVELAERLDSGPLEAVLKGIEASPFEGVVEAVNPVPKSAEQVLSDLMVIASDPVLLDELRSEPSVRALMEEPKIKQISEDPEVVGLILRGHYRELADHPRIWELMEDRKLRERVEQAQLPEILNRIRTGDQ